MNCDFCRAKRTAMIINSLDAENICPSFTGNRIIEEQLYHICLPMILSGSVGGILQVVYSEAEKQVVNNKLPVVQSFMMRRLR